jgi:hypothetical protein
MVGENVFAESPMGSKRGNIGFMPVIGNIVLEELISVIEESIDSQSRPGMLSFPFGNLSHTSILYYTILYVEVKYNVLKMMTVTLAILEPRASTLAMSLR